MKIFGPAEPDVPWRRNAIVWQLDDHQLAMGFADAATLIAKHWVTAGPNDLLFVPLVYNIRHALELVLKAAIRETAARHRAAGRTDEELQQDTLDDWLARKAGHSLSKLARRLDKMLTELDLDTLPQNIHKVLTTLHELDHRGDTFRYAKVRKEDKWESAPRPLVIKGNFGAKVDIVDMHEHFNDAFELISYGLMSELEQCAEYQKDMSELASPPEEDGWL